MRRAAVVVVLVLVVLLGAGGCGGSGGSSGRARPRTTATSAATVNLYEREGSAWRLAFGPWDARVGVAGMAVPGAKREGDGRTPSGTYGFGFAFGLQPDPGVRGEYRRITGPEIVWDDDPASVNYNRWVDRRVADPGVDPEPMANSPAYGHGIVIDYNPERTPGLGSAIFVHRSNGGPTAGCVSLPRDQLVTLLRWLDPARAPRIVLGSSEYLDAS